ncbi:putative naringenin-chalcone synthase [Phytomonospora endophytica]|uniref:Putative naringenin-chalcone synthase n=2 Tax=Phytomonospora endophytica TaxID=714109 RepID=A0A841FW04_9ACTN|nr:putative naringenin-chalcone synthase [Phytomonospora endophytica]
MGIATPPVYRQDEIWEEYFKGHSGDSDRAARIFANAGVETRHSVVDPRVEDVSTWSTAQRMQRYEIEAFPLAEEALAKALVSADIDAAELGLLAVVSCTGYATPGLDIRLAASLGASSDLQRLVVGHMGCYAAIPGLAAVADYVRLHRRPAALLCVELTSLHLQPSAALGVFNNEQAVAHSLFSDAAAAVVVVPDAPVGMEIGKIASRTDTAHTADMTWHVTDHGFRMGLSPRVPLVLARHAADTVNGLLAPTLTTADVDAYAVHPGGPRILDVVGKALALPESALTASREILREHGNCSSATILMVADRLRANNPEGGNTVAMAFGPGLTLYTAHLSGT